MTPRPRKPALPLAQRAERKARAALLQDLREQLGLSKWSEVAAELGLPIERVYRLVRGDNPTPHELEAITNAVSL